MRISALCFLGAAFAALVVGCTTSTPGSSTITGTIDQASFPAAVSSIAVISDSAAPTTAAVASDGSFSLTLQEGAAYRFTLGADGTIPLVLRTAEDRLQTQVTITGGDANVDIGSVRFWGGAGSGSTSVVTVPDTTPTTDDACVDGVMGRTGQPCSTGEATVACPESDHPGGFGKGKHHRGGHRDEEIEATPVADPATDALPEQAVAIPDRTLATGVGCADSCPGM